MNIKKNVRKIFTSYIDIKEAKQTSGNIVRLTEKKSVLNEVFKRTSSRRWKATEREKKKSISIVLKKNKKNLLLNFKKEEGGGVLSIRVLGYRRNNFQKEIFVLFLLSKIKSRWIIAARGKETALNPRVFSFC